jgi:Golgi nucleoside diphosphatase
VNDGQLDLESDTFEQLKPGLSFYADEPRKAAESLDPLMKIALNTVPEELQVCAYAC